MSVTYKSAGLDLELYEQAMARLPAIMQRTHTPRVMDLPGGFAGLFRLDNSSDFKRNYKEPVLVSGTDGVGTKLKVAIKLGVYDTVGIDLVAMSVNDCLCLGAEPLFFLDYIAMAKDDPDLIAAIVKGVGEGCVQAGAALMGGETAIMPDIYAPGDFDLAGFCVGVVEKSQIIDGKKIRPGDVVIGVGSSGFHSNGYSLVRKVVFEMAKLEVQTHVPELNRTVGQALLEPTKIYTKPIVSLLQQFDGESPIHGLAHITGGGIADNLVRVVPENCKVTIQRNSWSANPVFAWLQGLGQIEQQEMFNVFNMGLGFILVVAPEAADQVREHLTKEGLETWQIGAVTEGERAVQLV
jgi:phosphoribosylformylglycinamidine cyclo-ligase